MHSQEVPVAGQHLMYNQVILAASQEPAEMLIAETPDKSVRKIKEILILVKVGMLVRKVLIILLLSVLVRIRIIFKVLRQKFLQGKDRVKVCLSFQAKVVKVRDRVCLSVPRMVKINLIEE